MALRHRIVLNFDGEAERVSPEGLLETILSQTAGIGG